MLIYFRRQLLLDVAESFECKFIFTPEISVDIAAQLLANVSLGRGSSITTDTVRNKFLNYTIALLLFCFRVSVIIGIKLLFFDL